METRLEQCSVRALSGVDFRFSRRIVSLLPGCTPRSKPHASIIVRRYRDRLSESSSTVPNVRISDYHKNTPWTGLVRSSRRLSDVNHRASTHLAALRFPPFVAFIYYYFDLVFGVDLSSAAHPAARKTTSVARYF